MTRAGPDPPIGPYHRVPVQVYQSDPQAPQVAGRLIALIATRWPATPAEHVGSSAVPGLAGKNVIDLLLVAAPADIPAITAALLELGFQPQVPAAFPPTRPMLWGAFHHGATEYPVHVHVVPADSPEVAAMRGFRDALRADPHLRRRYAALKRAIVVGGPADPVAFTRAKHDWIAATLTHLGLASHPPRRLYQDDLDLPISRTATTTQNSPRQEIASSAIPSSLRSCCGKHEPPPLPSCQRAISNRAQPRVNQEGTAPHSPPGCGPRRPQDKEPPCRESPEGSCRAPS